MILYFDTETTGIIPGSICQLSYVMQTPKSVVAKNKYFTVDYVERGALAVHGLSVELLKELSHGKRFADSLDEIKKDFESADVIVAHNVSFDISFLREEFLRLNKVFFYNDAFCSMKSATPVLKLPRKTGLGYKYPKLQELCEYYEISQDGIKEKQAELFGEGSSFHDARFDTTALYLAVNSAMRGGVFKELTEKL